MSLAGAAGLFALLLIALNYAALTYARRRLPVHDPDLGQRLKARGIVNDWQFLGFALTSKLSTITDVRLRGAIITARVSFVAIFPAMIWAKSLGL